MSACRTKHMLENVDSMPGESLPLCIPKAGERRRSVEGQCPSSGRAETRVRNRYTVIGKGNETLIEGGIPQSGEEQAIMYVEALLVLALRPRHDVRCTQERRLGDAREWAATSPIIHKRGAEDVLADPLDDQPLHLRVL